MLGKTLDFKRYKGFFLFFLILISFSQFAISGSDNQHKRRLFYACKNLEEVTSDRGKVRALKKLKNLNIWLPWNIPSRVEYKIVKTIPNIR